MAFKKEQVKNIALDLLQNLLLNRFGGKGSGFSRPSGPPIRASRPFYKIECWIADLDLSLALHKIQIVNSVACAYPNFFLEFLLESKDYIVERIYGEDNLILSITVTDSQLNEIESNTFELIIIDIKSDLSPKNETDQPYQYSGNILKMVCLVKEPFNIMSTPVNMIIEPKSAGTGSQSKPLGKFGAAINKFTGFLDSFGNKIQDTLGAMMGAATNLTGSFSAISNEISTLSNNMNNLTGGAEQLLTVFSGAVPSEVMDSVTEISDGIQVANNLFLNISASAQAVGVEVSNIYSFTNNLTSGNTIDINGNPDILLNSVEKISSMNSNTSNLYIDFGNDAQTLNTSIEFINSKIDDTKNSILQLINDGDTTDYTAQLNELDSLKLINIDVLTSNENVSDKINKSLNTLNTFINMTELSKQKFSNITYNITDYDGVAPISTLDIKKLQVQNNAIQSIINSIDLNTLNKISVPLLLSETVRNNSTQFDGGAGNISNFTTNISTTLNSNLNIDINSAFNLDPTGIFGAGLSGNNPFTSITSAFSGGSGTSKFADKSPLDYATRLVQNFLPGIKYTINGKNKNDDKLEQITIPPLTFYGAIKYLNDMYSIFKGPMFSFCRWEDNTYCLWDLSKAIELPEDYTVEFITYGQDANKILNKSQQNRFITYNQLNVINAGNKAIGSQSHSQIFIKKDLHQFSKIIETNVEDLSSDSAADQDKKITFSQEFKNRKRVYSKGITGGPKNSNHYQLKNKIINSISNSCKVSFELNGDSTPITRLCRIGGAIKLNCHVPEYVQYGGKYVVSSSVISIKRTQQMRYSFKCLINCFRGNVEV